MDRVYTPDEIRKKFDALPSDIKMLVYGADMLTLIQKLGEKHKLHIDQIGGLETETADVMTGFSKPEDFAKNISVSLSIERERAEAIAKDVSDNLFIKIRDSMKKLAEEHGSEAPVISSSLTTTPNLSQKLPGSSQTAPMNMSVPPQVPTPAPVPQAKPLAMAEADLALTQKVITPPSPPSLPIKEGPLSAPKPPQKQEPQKPNTYKADPYREPPE